MSRGQLTIVVLRSEMLSANGFDLQALYTYISNLAILLFMSVYCIYMLL